MFDKCEQNLLSVYLKQPDTLQAPCSVEQNKDDTPDTAVVTGL